MSTAPKKPKPKPKAGDPNALQIITDGRDEAALLADTELSPAVNSGFTIKNLHAADYPNTDITALVGELSAQIKQANDGNLQRGEAMLITQAHTLDALFHNLTRRAVMNMGEYMDAADTYFRLALRAQSQCRATVETLAEIKNPKPVAFVRQANIANGPQQVNNGSTPSTETSRAREHQNQPNELLEELPHERLDTGTQSAAVGNDPSLEAVGAVNGTEVERR